MVVNAEINESQTSEAKEFYLSAPWAKYWDYTSEVSEAELAHTILEYFDAPDNQMSVGYQGALLSHDALSAQATSLAVGLAEGGLVRGDRIAVMLQNQPEFVVSVIAAWRLGLVVIPVNPMYRQVELRHILQDSAARAAIVLNDLAQHIEQVREGTQLEMIIGVEGPVSATPTAIQYSDLVEKQSLQKFTYPKPEDPAFLCYTSGTTGPAKGRCLPTVMSRWGPCCSSGFSCSTAMTLFSR